MERTPKTTLGPQNIWNTFTNLSNKKPTQPPNTTIQQHHCHHKQTKSEQKNSTNNIEHKTNRRIHRKNYLSAPINITVTLVTTSQFSLPTHRSNSNKTISRTNTHSHPKQPTLTKQHNLSNHHKINSRPYRTQVCTQQLDAHSTNTHHIHSKNTSNYMSQNTVKKPRTPTSAPNTTPNTKSKPFFITITTQTT